jgi:hypothetical protein
LLNAAAALTPDDATINPVTDLTAQAVNAVSCRLNWTVPQADDNVELGYYTVAYATENITEDNFHKFARPPVSIPKETETGRQITIAGLKPETEYYVAIRNSDNCKTSANSNVATIFTPQNQAPVFSGLIVDTTVIADHTHVEIDLREHFIDPEGEPMIFRAQSSAENIVYATIYSSNILIIDPRRVGQATIQITAEDLHKAQTMATINVRAVKPDELLAYPNPTGEKLSYSYILTEPAAVSIRIVNGAGRIMFQTPAKNLPEGRYKDEADLHGWDAGVYFVQYIKDGKTVNVKKIVKL